MRWTICLLAGCTAASGSTAVAQSGANVTLQLPSFSAFGVNTTVLVPDSGPAPLARQRQAFYGRTAYGGLYPQRAIGAQRRDTGTSVTAQVHDAREADEMVLRNARARRTNWVRGSTGAHAPREQQRQIDVVGDGLKSVAQAQRERAAQADAEQREAGNLLTKAREAQATGKGGVAAVYYGMAARRAAPAWRNEIEREARLAKRGDAAR